MSRRREHRTTKTVSIDAELAEWAERQAANENRPFSNFVETLLKKLRAEEQGKEKEMEPA